MAYGVLISIHVVHKNMPEFKKTHRQRLPQTGTISDKGVYTIVKEKSGTGASKWGRLKSGVGWISLDYVKKI